MTINQSIQAAIHHHQAGRLTDAEAIYRQILTLQPTHADALHLLGVLAAQTGRAPLAVELIERAVAANPNAASYRLHLGNALRETGRTDQAIEAWRHAIRLDPESTDAAIHFNLGVALMEQRQVDAAIAAYQKALTIKPDFHGARNNLGIALSDAGKLDEAIETYQQIIRMRPDAESYNNLGNVLAKAGRLDEAVAACRQALQLKSDAEFRFNLGIMLGKFGQLVEAIASHREAARRAPENSSFHNHLGLLLGENRQFNEAADSFRQAIRLDEKNPAPWLSLGNALVGADRPDDAIAAYRQAIHLNPDYAEGHHNLGHTLADKRQFADAIPHYREAIRLKPDYADAYYNLGNALLETWQLDAAAAAHEEAIRLRPLWADPHWNLGLILLLQGDLERGWVEYEWRLQLKGFLSIGHPVDKPIWNGADFKGRTLVLWAEQGYGDTIQFIRYAPQVASLGGRVILKCQPELAPLLRDVAGVQQIFTTDPLPPFDLQCPLLSLPRAFATGLKSIPAEVPYLRPDPSLVQAWSKKLGPSRGKVRVGLAWAGHAIHKNDRTRSIRLSQLASLSTVAGVEFFSLQKGDAALQALAPPAGMELIDHSSDFRDFAETAAMISHLDVIISVDTAVAHLAGAIGKPVWLLLAARPDWRWLLERDDSPWYPTMRFFRQREQGDWANLIERLREALDMAVTSPDWSERKFGAQPSGPLSPVRRGEG